MSQATATLPEGWSKILDEVRQRLDLALASANARLEQMPRVDAESTTPDRQQECTHLLAHLQGLSERMQAAENVIQEVGAALQAEETLLQQNQSASGSLRQKLAAWAGRAIG